MHHSAKSAFTLVELLVVIAIISILAGLLLPALEGALKTSRNIVCQNNLRGTAFNFQMYADDNDSFSPPFLDPTNNRRWSTNLQIGGYSDDLNLCACPSWNPFRYANANTSYGFLIYTIWRNEDGVFVDQLNGTVLTPWAKGNRIKNYRYIDYLRLTRPSGIGILVDSINVNIYGIPDPETNPQYFQCQSTTNWWHFRHHYQANMAYSDGHVGSLACSYSEIREKLYASAYLLSPQPAFACDN